MKEVNELAGQTQQPNGSKQMTQATPSGNGVFIRRAKGQSFEEFKKVCIQRFREAGLIKD